MMVLIQTDMHRSLCQKNEAGDFTVEFYSKQIPLFNTAADFAKCE